MAKKAVKTKTRKAKTSTSKGLTKTQRIRKYLERHPEHTWKLAEPSMAKHGIAGTYFWVIKSKKKEGNGGGSTRKKRSGKKTPAGRKANVKASNNGSSQQMQQAISFARDCGGIDDAIAALQELKSLQV